MDIQCDEASYFALCRIGAVGDSLLPEKRSGRTELFWASQDVDGYTVVSCLGTVWIYR